MRLQYMSHHDVCRRDTCLIMASHFILNVLQYVFCCNISHDDVIKWKHFPRNWPFARGIHPVNSPHKGQWRGALVFSLIYARINDSVNTGEAGDLRSNHAHDDIIVMTPMHYSGQSQHDRCNCNTVKPVYNDHLMGYFSAFWSSSRWPRAT